jgi:NAD(P)-dependent dehydrogenase (short-subunit alcohol dehydrogenase family)
MASMSTSLRRWRVFITGSADGLGMIAASILAERGHAVTLHARDDARGAAARERLPGAEDVLVGDVSTVASTRQLAQQANAKGRYDAVIHNVGVGFRDPGRVETADHLERTFAVNVLAPYLLTAVMAPPRRLVYVSSGMHRGGQPSLEDPQYVARRWSATQAYADSKLLDTVLAFAVARRWPRVLSNAVEPGWVPTKMGGPGAPDDLWLGAVTQAWLAVSDDPRATVTGSYFYHQQPRDAHPAARDRRLQDQLLAYCATLTGVTLPEPPETETARGPGGVERRA